MNSYDGPTPDQMAHFDQAFADVNRRVNDLISAHRAQLAEAKAPREVDIVGLSKWLVDNTEPIDLAEMLAVSVHRLLDHEGGIATHA